MVDADDDHRRRRPLVDRLVRGLGKTPVLPRHEGALRLEEVLPVLHVQDGIPHLRTFRVTGRQVDADSAFVAENLRLELGNPIECAAAELAPAILQPQHAPERRAKRVAHLPHQARISR